MDENNTNDNDVVAEELDDSVVGEENVQAAIKKLREALKLAQKEKEEYLTGWQRAKADNVNAKRIADAERKEIIAFSNKNLIEEILPVLDSFEMAIGNKEVWEKVDKNWRSGVEYIYSQLKKTLTDNGLLEVNPMGEKFDVTRDEVLNYEPVNDEKQDGIITDVIQKGYSLGGKPLKAPKVKVAEFRK